MAQPEPAPLSDQGRPDTSAANRNLPLRVASAIVLAPLAIAAAWAGGWPFAVFWGLAGLGVWWEWTSMVAASAARHVMWTGAGALTLTLALAGTGRILPALAVMVLGAGAVNVVAPTGRGPWVGAGLVYSGLLIVAPVALRSNEGSGFAAILFLFAVVWSTDILGYVVGRTVGGPKLWPRVSPNKTWSGACAGLAASVGAAITFAFTTEAGPAGYLVLVAVALSIASQGGDLLESAVKRRFGAKDSSGIIPGHGGLMDRLDGFLAAAVLAAAWVGVRVALEGPGRGLLQW